MEQTLEKNCKKLAQRQDETAALKAIQNISWFPIT